MLRYLMIIIKFIIFLLQSTNLKKCKKIYIDINVSVLSKNKDSKDITINFTFEK